MIIQHRLIGTKGVFYVQGDTGFAAEILYTKLSPVKMIIEHTNVSDALRGQNVGYQLVHSAVEYAREHRIKIIPLCPFANSVFKKKPEFADVLSI